jgi:hypothetical protein
MPDANERGTSRPPRGGLRFPRMSDVLDVSEEMIAFVEKYQKVWESEAKATMALGEFLSFRAESMRYQVEMMRAGSDSFRRYVEWTDALMSFRPDRLLDAFLRPPERGPATPDRTEDDE